MNKQIKLLSIFLLIILKSNAQYYYSDIISNKLVNANYVLLKNNKVKNIILKNVRQTDEDENSFKVQQKFSNNFTELKTETKLVNGTEKVAVTTYNNNKILKKEDEGLNINSLVRYEYDANEKLIAIKTSSIDTSVLDGFFENHLFEYDAKGIVSKMYKIKNNTDTTTVLFIQDEHNNIGEERWYRKNEMIETYYYYYNDKNQLTDIVKFNTKYKKMLPEFLFEYNDNNQLTQQTHIPFGSNKYTVTKYFYNNNGLKQFEKLYTKTGELLSNLEYTYD